MNWIVSRGNGGASRVMVIWGVVFTTITQSKGHHSGAFRVFAWPSGAEGTNSKNEENTPVCPWRRMVSGRCRVNRGSADDKQTTQRRDSCQKRKPYFFMSQLYFRRFLYCIQKFFTIEYISDLEILVKTAPVTSTLFFVTALCVSKSLWLHAWDDELMLTYVLIWCVPVYTYVLI